MTGWYAIFCKANRETVAEMNLANQGYEVYLPRIHARRRRANKWVNFLEPLFPRYLFIKVRNGAECIAPVRSTVGVSEVVQFGGQPATVSDDVIKELRKHENDVSGDHSHAPLFAPGDAVKFIDGPFAGLQGLFRSNCRQERAIVLLEFLGRTNRLQVDRCSLIRVLQ